MGMDFALTRSNLPAPAGGATHWGGTPAVEEIPFEAGTGGYTELPGGISLYVGSIDFRRRSLSGWMWVAADHRHVWLRDQKAGEPVILHGCDGQTREVKITSVGRNSVTGSVVLPKSRRRAVAGAA
jgi:hypothetical protein